MLLVPFWSMERAGFSRLTRRGGDRIELRIGENSAVCTALLNPVSPPNVNVHRAMAARWWTTR